MVITPLPSARRFEPYEFFFAGKVGMVAALEYAAAIGIGEIALRNAELATHLRNRLADVPGVSIHDKGVRKSSIVTFTVRGHHASDVRRTLRTRSINVSTSSQSSARLDFPQRNLDEVVRASVHYFNTTSEIDALADAVAGL
jgi:selenocysteine lyase/cysteine desulfurase